MAGVMSNGRADQFRRRKAMSLLGHYTLKSGDDHEAQTTAMTALVDGSKAEGIARLHCSCFSTDDPLRFVGVLEFADDAARQAF
jgi:hypothetical protein